MLDQSKKELDKIMRAYQEDLEGMRVENETEKAAQKKFRDDFEQLKHKVIWPAVVDVGNALTEYGHDFHVSEEEEYTDGTAVFHPASITMNIYPATLEKYFKKPESTPYISFVADSYAKRVKIVVSTMMPNEGGIVGDHGVYNMEQITPDFVEKEIVVVLKNIPVFHQVS